MPYAQIILNGQHFVRILKELVFEYLSYSELDTMTAFRMFFSERIADINGHMQIFHSSKYFTTGKSYCCNNEVNTEALILSLDFRI